MTNISFIKDIEIDLEGRFVPVRFQNGSASFEENQTKPAAGELYKTTLKFRIAGIDDTSIRVVRQLKDAQRLRISDVNGLRLTMGSYDLPAVAEIERVISNKPGGFRGYEVSVKWESADPVPSESFI